MSEKVKFIATDKAVKKDNLKLLAGVENGVAYTGQHRDPKKPDTSDNLTFEQMIGKVPLNKEQMDRFPYVIVPGEYYYIHNNQMFDKKDPKDKAIMDFALLTGTVAESKAKFNRQKHKGYFEDKDLEATEDIRKFSIIAEAMEKVKNANADQIIEVALFVDYLIPVANIDVKRFSHSRMIAALYNLCQTNPTDIIKAFSNDAKDDIFILNLCRYSIIRKEVNGFYDGTKYLGNTLQSVRDFQNKKENAPAVDRWGRELLVKQGKVDKSAVSNIAEEDALNKAKAMVLDGMYEKALIMLSEIKLPSMQSEVAKLKEKITQELEKGKDDDFDLSGFSENQKEYYSEIKDHTVDKLAGIAAVKKFGKKDELKEKDKNELLVMILKTVK